MGRARARLAHDPSQVERTIPTPSWWSSGGSATDNLDTAELMQRLGRSG